MSTSIAKNLVSLEDLRIEDCEEMVEVIEDGTYASIEFPKLKYLRLENLPNLTAFCQGVQTIKFPELTDLKIGNLPKLNSVCPLNSETTHDDTTFHFLCNQKVEIGGLEILWLFGLGDNISNIWCQQITINFFNTLKKLIIFNLNGIRSLMSTSIAKNLVSLEYLYISDCKKMVEVIEDNTDASIEFPKLKKLKLDDLPNLTAFCQGLQTIKFPELTDLTIGNLSKLNSVCPLNSETTHGDTTFHVLCNQKVEFGGLYGLNVSNFENNIKSIWCDRIPINFFNNIQKLYISGLDGTRSLMSYSIAIKLVSLKSLDISVCKEMVEVIEVIDDDKEVLVDDIKCLFPTLTRLQISWMRKLRRFWQWNHTLELPLLEEVTIDGCPVMETFSLGSLNTPNIRRIKIQNHEMDGQKGLNYAIHQVRIVNQVEIEDEDEDENDDLE